jgi:hypothetical protein
MFLNEAFFKTRSRECIVGIAENHGKMADLSQVLHPYDGFMLK